MIQPDTCWDNFMILLDGRPSAPAGLCASMPYDKYIACGNQTITEEEYIEEMSKYLKKNCTECDYFKKYNEKLRGVK